MTVSVRMEPVLEKQLELAAKRKGVTKSQFIVDAVRHALGHTNPYELLLQVKAEAALQVRDGDGDDDERGYRGDLSDSDATRAFITAKLNASMASTLVDAGAMVALFGDHEPHSAHYHALLRRAAAERWHLSTTWPCVVEASHMLRPAHRYMLLRWVSHGAVAVFPFQQESLSDFLELMERYTEEPRTEMDLADASLVWLANETNVTAVMTTDRRDFSRYRLPDGRAFEIL